MKAFLISSCLFAILFSCGSKTVNHSVLENTSTTASKSVFPQFIICSHTLPSMYELRMKFLSDSSAEAYLKHSLLSDGRLRLDLATFTPNEVGFLKYEAGVINEDGDRNSATFRINAAMIGQSRNYFKIKTDFLEVAHGRSTFEEFICKSSTDKTSDLAKNFKPII
ncbi:MAG: hypothetical protein NTV34_10085 [Proteobacteria bacterium]|nr:hypothetical protein [Pseudomonadota bacterium]